VDETEIGFPYIKEEDLIDYIQNMIFDLGHGAPTPIKNGGSLSGFTYCSRQLGVKTKFVKVSLVKAKQLLAENSLAPVITSTVVVGNNSRITVTQRKLKDFDGRYVTSNSHKNNYLTTVKKLITDYKSSVSAV
jgi:hypothetical protein